MFNTFLHRDRHRMVIRQVVEVGALLLFLGLALERGEARLQGSDARPLLSRRLVGLCKGCSCYNERWSSSRHGCFSLLWYLCGDLVNERCLALVLERWCLGKALCPTTASNLASACRERDNSSRAGERDVLWTNAGLSPAFWGSAAEWYGFSSKSAPRLRRRERARLRVATRLSSRAFRALLFAVK